MMKQKILIIAAAVLVAAAATGYWLMQPPAEAPAAPSPDTTELMTDPNAIEAAVKKRVETKAKLHAYKAQLAIYEKILQHAPGSAEAKRRVDTLRQSIEELEKQNAPR